ncbi:MAG: TlpA family protein disulfide reductase, partial [Bacteroidetes bacterium]|nr:TlpA family protein disulfide reductase [Bacteroidota bacterium]
MLRVFLSLIFQLVVVLVMARPDVGAGPGKPLAFRSGQWRAYLERKDGNNIVFNFEVKDSAGKKVLYIRNAAERLLVDDISREGDSVIIKLPLYESQLRAAITKEGNLEGVWIRHLVSDFLVVPFKAFYGQASRWPAAGGKGSVAGRWAAVFRSLNGKDTTFRVGEFKQVGNKVTGTFLDAGGDLRYLEGAVTGDSLKLSCFDVTYAYFFTA